MFGLANLLSYFAAAHTFGTKCTMNASVIHNFLGFPHWWQYMTLQYDQQGICSPVFNGPSDLFPIALAVLDILLRVAGIVAVVSIIVAGVEYVFASGNSEKGANARKRIINSLIGLAIALVAAATVSFIGQAVAP